MRRSGDQITGEDAASAGLQKPLGERPHKEPEQLDPEGRKSQAGQKRKQRSGLTAGHFPVHLVLLVQMPFRWAALRGRYYVHLVQMHGPFPNSVQVGGPLFAGLSYRG